VHLDTLLKESVNWKNKHIGMVLLLEKEESLMEDKRNQQGAEAPHSSEAQKAHPTGEIVVVA